VLEKVQEELAEITAAKDAEEREAEMGDLLFTLVNFCRHTGINAADALARSNAKFKRRYQSVERQAWETKREVSDLKLEEMDAYWETAKGEE